MLARLGEELEKLRLRGKLRSLHPAAIGEGAVLTLAGRKAVNFASWDILALRANPKLKRAVQSEIEVSGLGSFSPRMVTGTSPRHLRCEQRLAQFMGQARALLFSSKNQTVLSLVTALCTEEDVILFDETMQSPVADAAYLVNAAAVPYPDHDLDKLELKLKEAQGAAKRLIFLDYLSPTSGMICDLAAFLSLAQAYDAWIVVDDSCALGVIGARGAGSAEQYAKDNRIVCRYGDLSLALGCFGGFVCGGDLLMQYLLARSRTFCGEPAMPAALAAGIEAVLDQSELMIAIRERVARFAGYLRNEISRISGIPISHDDSPLVCLPCPDRIHAARLTEALFEQGYLVEALEGVQPRSERAVVRMIVSALHSEKDIQGLLSAYDGIGARALG